MSSDSSKSNRSIVAVCLLFVVAIAGYFVFRPASDTNSKGTPEEYVTALAPIVEQAQKIADQIETTPPGPELFGAASALETGWAEVRTGPGYDRQTHDDFIIVFGSFVTRLKSAGLIWKTLNDGVLEDASKTESKQLEILFTLQSLNGVETAAQLLAKRGLEIGELLSRTNLAFEVTNSLARAPEVLAGAVTLFHELESGPTTP